VVGRVCARLDAVSFYLVDCVVALLALAAVFVMIMYGNPHPVGLHHLSGWSYTWACGTAVPLVWRRRAPFIVAMAVATAASVYGSVHVAQRPPMPFGVLVASYTLADRGGVWQRRAGVAAGLAGVFVAFPSDAFTSQQQPLLIVFGAYALGAVVRTLRSYAARLEVRARDLERERDGEAERAALRERARIAREMHDILGHAVSIMVVQAEAGAVVAGDEERAVAVFDAVAAAGREAMAQLRRLLGLLAEGGPGDGRLAPQPGLADLESLVAGVRASGLAVSVRVIGVAYHVPRDLEAAVYRTVQEGLTNTVRHAGAAGAVVRIEWGVRGVVVRMSDDGRGAVPGRAAGRGLVGIRERTAAFGGGMTAGPNVRGPGFVVVARFPVPLSSRRGGVA
jgi:signal transduction histidine kinase